MLRSAITVMIPLWFLLSSWSAMADVILTYTGKPLAPLDPGYIGPLGSVRAVIRLKDGALDSGFFGLNNYLPSDQSAVVSATLSDGERTSEYKDRAQRFEIALWLVNDSIVDWRISGSFITLLGPRSTGVGIGSAVPAAKQCPALDILVATGRAISCALGEWTISNVPEKEPPPVRKDPCAGDTFREMVTSAAELRSLAADVERDDVLFANVAIESIAAGRRSPFANVALDVNEADFESFFSGESMRLSKARSVVVETLRRKADFREMLGYSGLYREPGRVPATPGIGIDILDYICSLDPKAMTDNAWSALWMAGYVDYELYQSVKWLMWIRYYGEIAAAIAEAASNAFLLAELGFWSPAKSLVRVGGVEVATYMTQRGTLKALATKSIPRLAASSGVRQRIVLGKLGKLGDPTSYVAVSNALRAARFSVPERVWNAWSLSERKLANLRFLDWAIARDMEIVLASPVKSIAATDGAFLEELLYLQGKGYRLSDDGLRMIK